MSAAVAFFFGYLFTQCVCGAHDESHEHGENTEKIAEVAKKYLGLKKFASCEEFVFNILKMAGAKVKMPFSAKSWGTLDQWGEDLCWKNRQGGDDVAIHVGDVVSNKHRVGIVTSLNPGRTATVVLDQVMETSLGFRKNEEFVVWCYICDLHE
ncbi:uncharacterized protein LOC121386827 [Gigantopelta aegis]|uniref:uncharacterized protein LOC121386827 n=1 Tax=Gigantopelta aegis TaxID=1735272 RepID=UPI001B88DDEA|nr:uncharacterized protein LOC121386827 [Gigantopelta aegis]